MDSNLWLTDNEQHAWRTYLRAHWRLAGELHRQLQAESGLSLADYGVLVHLSEAPEGRMRPFELARCLQWEQSRLSHQLKRMQKRELVVKRECSQDARGAFIEITESGRGTLAGAAPKHVRTVRQVFFNELSGEQLAALAEISERILRKLDSLEE
ncbi:MAG: MarR family transcriptional regulator [Longispora sp.]|nr:MarR family transcriptional regulator [Longispora sp. (in: high G+C Gram-positive bacteria)]